MATPANILTAVRYHRHNTSPDTPISTESLQSFVESAKLYSHRVVIGIDASDILLLAHVESTFPHAHILKPQETVADLPQPTSNITSNDGRVLILPIQPYWKFTVALNSLLATALRLSYSYILYASTETRIRPAEVATLSSFFTPDDTTLVAGKALAPHSFTHDPSGERIRIPLTGLTSPWNTFALWSVQKLSATGFLMISDANTTAGRSAIEEVPTIAIHQMLRPDKARAYLIKTDEAGGWETEFEDPKRKEWQRAKLESKNASAESHLRMVGLDETKAWVWHVDAMNVRVADAEGTE
ncbi:hypothetical protein BC937DRAFT_89051 [Endogone sp. FLAS-F59071]|nr:hypothetical protein BC937DRAFT_89051 [Endogone sp. FLAS-F59071]|eukprot:RUS18190.1 hypothetical protein BC937DRAFT_89051 [Endogone sp. FLAS-F59071]